jgi:hypothetical protein
VGLSFPLGFTAIQRWRTVARTFGESLAFSKAFIYVGIGQFINLGLPTVLGFDSVRAWKLHKQGLSIGVASRLVVVDRLCSLFTLLIVIALGMPHLSALHGSEIFKHSAVLAFFLGSIGLAFVSSAQLVTHVISNTSRVEHFYQLSRDFWERDGDNQDPFLEHLQPPVSHRHRALPFSFGRSHALRKGSHPKETPSSDSIKFRVEAAGIGHPVAGAPLLDTIRS